MPDTATAINAEEAKKLRRLKKAERRAKQRVANVGRAEKMHKARLAWEAETPPRPVPPDAPRLNIACSGWFYWDWKGLFYPTQMPTSEWFPYYQSQFDTVELNAPFYAWPTVATVKSWLRQLSDRDFIYTVKVCELITHVRQFDDCSGLIRDFGLIADMLGERMGCFLFQLPPSVHYSRDMLDRIVSQLDHSRRNVVEFRHKSWWNEEVYTAFRAHDTIFCSCSGPKLPDDLIATTDDIYVRFHGTETWYRHKYSAAEIEVWAERIRQSGARRVWAYFNNDYGGNAIADARQLSDALS